ncbi:hypothetical protein [Methanosarcina horonobensis]|nr:hypothetical protein [Methanosarcina horonobensis]
MILGEGNKPSLKSIQSAVGRDYFGDFSGGEISVWRGAGRGIIFGWE